MIRTCDPGRPSRAKALGSDQNLNDTSKGDLRLFVGMLCGPGESPAFRILGSDLDYRHEQETGERYKRGESPHRRLNRSFRGYGDKQHALLTDLNAKGAAVFMTINADDGQSGRGKPPATKNITRVRAVFVDLDENGETGKKLVEACELEPHLIVNTSPGRFQAYWLTNDVPLGEFSALQRAIACRFGGDQSVNDLSRIMRVPGMLHNKASTPHLARVIAARPASPLYSHDQLQQAFAPYAAPQARKGRPRAVKYADEPVRQGERNTRLFEMARGFVNKGLDEAAANARIQRINATKLEEPLDAREVDEIVCKAFASPSVGQTSIPHVVLDAPEFHRLGPNAIYLLLMAWRRAPEQRSQPFALPIGDFVARFGKNNKGFYDARRELVRHGFVIEHGQHAIQRQAGMRGRDATLYRLGIGFECISYTQIQGDLSVDPTQVESTSPPRRKSHHHTGGATDFVVDGLDVEALALRDGLDAAGEGAYGE